MVKPDDAKDVLAAIGLYEDGDEDCNNALIDLESGLNPATVDEVLDYLWKSIQIEGIMTPGGQNPSLVGILLVLPDKERQWGDDGGIGIVRKVQGVLGSRHTDSFVVGPRLVREKSAKQSRTVNHGQRKSEAEIQARPHSRRLSTVAIRAWDVPLQGEGGGLP
ncbi:MAG: hypothetical protein ACLPR9_11085 [Acidimicrobiales bacterium]